MKTGLSPLLVFSLLAAVAAPSVAQDGASSESFSTTRSSQSAEVVEDIGEIEAAGGAAASKFRTSVNFRANYTSNAKLSGNHGSGDVLSMPTLEVGFNTQLGHGFGFDIAARIESVLYARFDERSFAGYSAVATLDWRSRPNTPRLYVSAEPYRYDSYDTGDLMTQALGVTAGTDWGFGFNAGNSYAAVGYSFSHYFADPSIDNRNAHRLVASVTHQLNPKLYGQLFYAYQYTLFEDVDRDDSRHILGLNLIYQINRRFFATATATFVDNESTQDQASYQAANAALGLTLQF